MENYLEENYLDETLGKHAAVDSLLPDAKFCVRGGVVEWMDDKLVQPSESAIQTEMKRLQAEYDLKKYQRQREFEYPIIGEQLDMLWHAIDTNTLDKTSDFYTNLKAVKDKYPKE